MLNLVAALEKGKN